MTKGIRIGLIVLLFFLLILVRAFASKLFYDPFIEFFKNDYLTSNFPEFSYSKLFANLLNRYMLNTLISLVIVYLFFQSKKVILFAIKFYAIAFIILIASYFILLKSEFSDGYLLAFYIRRMLIHPVFLLLLLPAFYYQRRMLQK